MAKTIWDSSVRSAITERAMRVAAETIKRLGAPAVLVKGGHRLEPLANGANISNEAVDIRGDAVP